MLGTFTAMPAVDLLPLANCHGNASGFQIFLEFWRRHAWHLYEAFNNSFLFWQSRKHRSWTAQAGTEGLKSALLCMDAICGPQHVSVQEAMMAWSGCSWSASWLLIQTIHWQICRRWCFCGLAGDGAPWKRHSSNQWAPVLGTFAAKHMPALTCYPCKLS